MTKKKNFRLEFISDSCCQLFFFVKKHKKTIFSIVILGSALTIKKRIVKADDFPFARRPGDFERLKEAEIFKNAMLENQGKIEILRKGAEIIKAEILRGIDDPHQKDIANAVITTKDIAFQIVTAGASGLCYVICSGFMGIGTYTAFIKVWQTYSIPAKNYLLRLCLSISSNTKNE